MGRHERIPGSDDRHLNCPMDVDCDSAGRVYVTDSFNNRVQVFNSDGNVLKTIQIERPHLVQVHKKTGIVYISHFGRRQGISVPCISKFKSFPDFQEIRRWYDIPSSVMTLDSWSIKPRLWISGIWADRKGERVVFSKEALLRVYEDDDTDELKLVSDFEREAYSENESSFRWQGGMGNKVVCDPLRERAYWDNKWIFDLPTGKLLGRASMGRLSPSDIAFDKHGYMHIHQGGHAAPKPIIRVSADHVENGEYVEVPYDYGVEFGGYKGVILPPATDTQFYSWGMGVNMQGDISVVNHIGYVPKLQDEVTPLIALSQEERRKVGMWVFDSFTAWLKKLAELERLSEDLFFIRPRPGIPLYGGTIWTYRRSGELNTQAGVIAGPRINGVQIDEEGFVYFTNARRRYIQGKPFLYGRGGNFGGPPYIPHNLTPFTGTYMKTKAKEVDFILRNPIIPMEPPPNRPPDLAHPAEGDFGAYLGEKGWVWVESAEWMYAGASGIVAEHCDCSQMRASLDWFKRSFVPELYRHSIGVLDTNGNLICHVGQYGNFDNKGIVMIRGHYVSATDNYLVISDWGQRLIVTKLQYHAEEMADITIR